MEYNGKSTYYNKTIDVAEITALSYETNASFQKRYPKEKGGYRVIGAIGKGIKHEIGTWKHNGKEFAYYELNYSKYQYGIKGYIEVEQDTFLAIIGKDYRKILQPIGVLLTIGIVALGIFYLTQQNGPVLDPGAQKYQADVELPENMDKTKIAIPGYGDIQMNAGEDKAYIALWNPDDNPCYFKFEIVLSESEESIYKSGLIPPGNAVTTVKFNREFEKGVHPITIRIQTFDLEDYTKGLNGGEVKTRLVSMAKE